MIGEEINEDMIVVHKDKYILKMNRTLEYDETLSLLGRLNATQKSAENYTRGYFWDYNNGTIYGIKTENGKPEIEINKPIIRNSDKNHKKNYEDLKTISKKIKGILKQISEDMSSDKKREELKFLGYYFEKHQIVFDSLERNLLDGELALIVVAKENNNSKSSLPEVDKTQKIIPDFSGNPT